MLDEVFATFYDAVLAPGERRGVGDLRAQLLGGLSGRVLELGAGTGLNLRHYPRDLDALLLTEPLPQMVRRLRERAADDRPDARIIEAPAERLPIPDASVDHVVATYVLCSVEDPEATLAEVRRVLVDGGTFVVLEHVAAPGRVGTLQSVIEPGWKVITRGCHLRRHTRELMRAAGFDTSAVVEVEPTGSVPVVRHAIAGIAVARTSGDVPSSR